MTRYLLKAKVRQDIGGGNVKHLREKNILPGVLYGHNMETKSIQMDALEAGKYLQMHGVGSNLDIELAGEKVFVLIKEIQQDSILGTPLHIDFQALTMGEKVKVRVPLHFINGDKLGSDKVLQELTHEIEMQVLPKDLIESITVDVEGAELGVSVKVDELPVTSDERYEILTDLTSLVYTITAPTKYEEPVVEEDTGELKSVVENVDTPQPPADAEK